MWQLARSTVRGDEGIVGWRICATFGDTLFLPAIALPWQQHRIFYVHLWTFSAWLATLETILFVRLLHYLGIGFASVSSIAGVAWLTHSIFVLQTAFILLPQSFPCETSYASQDAWSEPYRILVSQTCLLITSWNEGIYKNGSNSPKVEILPIFIQV